MTRDREDTVAIHPPAPIVDTLGKQRHERWRRAFERERLGVWPGRESTGRFDEIPGPVRLGRASSEVRPVGMAEYGRGRG